MCGIAGVITSGVQRVDREDLGRMARLIAHRGPDGEGIWVNDTQTAGLVHRRLAIIDVSERGHQPMASADGRYVIVYNGEVFNFLELRRELVAKGSVFHSDSDTEVVVEAWRHWGQKMLLRFNGMWALAIHDRQSGEVFFARDRFGIKPLLIAQAGDRLAFASEMRALLALPWVDASIQPAIAERLLFDPFSIEGSAQTLHRGISRLPAGHCAVWRDGQLHTERWWNTTEHLVDVPGTPQARVERFRELFLDAVTLRMRSDVPIGTCLSGGFDSSAIACAMAGVSAGQNPMERKAEDWRHAFIASFPGQSNDETPLALEAAAYAGVTPHLLSFDQVDPLDQIERILEDLDDVYLGLTTAPWMIYRELRNARTLVSLDGHGADELMGAYRQDGQGAAFALRNQVARWSHDSRARRALIDKAKLGMLSWKGMNFLRRGHLNAPEELAIPSDDDVLPAHWGALNRRLYRMFHATVLPTILRNFDRISMAHGVEVRMPFMDWRLVTYVMSLPDEEKSNAEYSKFIARQAMAGAMPESIRSAKRKVGFNSPMPEWLNGERMHRWVMELLDQRNDGFDAIVDTTRLREAVRRLQARQAWNWENTGRLWPYINLKWRMDRLSAKESACV
jgi:asparagine synthase (glutamine-hydrolysing)